VRIGVDNRFAGDRVAGEKYVLQDFRKEEMEVLKKVFDEVCKNLTNKLIA